MQISQVQPDIPVSRQSEQRLPGGLWAALAQRIPTPPKPAPDPTGRNPGTSFDAPVGLWSTLTRTAAGHSHVPFPDSRQATAVAIQIPGGIWGHVIERTDLAQYRPQAVPDIAAETVIEGDQTYTVLRSPRGAYVRLTPAEAELWHAMDGSQTVAQLATSGFIRFKQLLPVAGLVQNLKHQGFLIDTPINIYQQLQSGLERYSAEGWGRRLLATLKSRTFAINGIDGAVTALYRSIGWMFFTRPFHLLHAGVSVAGLFAFGLALGRDQQSSTFQLVDAGGMTASLLALWLALLVSFVLHETAHALAVKHFGRTVWRGGLMLYYGMPAAFVDTSDIWLANRRARILVSAAGPLSDLLVGGAAALYAYSFPTAPFSAAAYKLAFACYVATLFNLNPLLELDGYYMLVDALRLPNLRQRALMFVGGPFWNRLRTKAPFSREERIFGLYGLLTALYTMCAIMFAFLFWQRQLVSVIEQLWSGGWSGRIMALLIVGGIVVPSAIGLLLAAWGLLHGGANWLYRRGYGRRPAMLVTTLLILTGVLAILPLRFGTPAAGTGSVLITLIEPLLWGVALLALGAIRPDYRGADIGPALDALLIAHVLLVFTAIGRTADEFVQMPSLLWMICTGTALLLVLLAGFAALLDVDLHQASQRELGTTAFLAVVAFGFGGLAIRQSEFALPEAHFSLILATAAPVYCGTLALALLLPHMLGLRDSRLLWCWLPLWMGIGVQTGAYALNLTLTARTHPLVYTLGIGAAGLWASAWCVHYVTLRTLSPADLHWPIETAMSESQRLQRAFRLSYAGCYRLLRAVYGSRRAQALDDRMDVLAATANWEITLDRDQVRISPTLAAQALDTQGSRYAEALRYTVATIEEIAGSRFARRVIQAAYDALPWPEREAADRRCFPNTPWAHDLSRSFGNARRARLRLLRQVDLFVTCDDEELEAIASQLQTLRLRAGHEVLAASATPPGIWIIEAGEVAVWRDREPVDELHRGESFGLIADTAAGRSAVSYRTTVESSLLFLPTADLRTLLNEHAPHTAEGLETLKILRLLERVPLFADVPRHTLRGLARVAQRQEVPARHIVVRQDQPSGIFYIIKQGQAAVVARDQANAVCAPAHRPTRVVAQLGPEEFFGELELLRGTPPVASVVSMTPMVLLALPHTAIAALLLGSNSVAHNLERVGSGRWLDLRARAPADSTGKVIRR